MTIPQAIKILDWYEPSSVTKEAHAEWVSAMKVISQALGVVWTAPRNEGDQDAGT